MVKPKTKFINLDHLKNDLPAGIVVALIALPLCLGIALASGAPLFSGIIAGIIGGIVVGMASHSPLSVSGPAAGLTVIVFVAIEKLGSYESFLLAVVLAGVIQIILGFIKAGTIGLYFPSSVIKGMLAAIGVILILKQIPHAFGYDADYIGDVSFNQSDHENTFSEIFIAIQKSSMGAVIICSVALLIILIWDKPFLKKINFIPAPLIVVASGIFINYIFSITGSSLELMQEHLVQIPIFNNLGDFTKSFIFPDFSGIMNIEIYTVALTLAIIASLETLLSVEAIDKLDPYKRNTPVNRELKAQGIGNIISGLIGGLPITAVIVRGSANISSGAKTKTSAILHGLILLIAVLTVPSMLNKIPLASLAAILLIIGYKLAKISLFKSMYKLGWEQFIPFLVTVLAIVFTDLLVGISIGLGVSVVFILKRNMRSALSRKFNDEVIELVLAEEVSFLNKAGIQLTLDSIKENQKVIINGAHCKYIDYDVLEIINNFKENATLKDIEVTFINIKSSYKSKEFYQSTKDKDYAAIV